MSETCLNCKHPIAANFCENCGQKRYTRIDRQYIIKELQYTILHTNKGFFYSLKHILRNPGKTARDFIDGKRVNHYKPLLLIFVLAGISTFISFKAFDMQDLMIKSVDNKTEASGFLVKLNTYLASYGTIFTLLLVPFFAGTTRIAFKKWGHNYYEHVIINAYILSVYTLLSILLVVLPSLILRDTPVVYKTLSQFSIVLVPFILVWFFKHFYADKSLSAIIYRVLGALGLTAVGIILIVIPIVIAAIVILAQTGVDVFK